MIAFIYLFIMHGLADYLTFSAPERKPGELFDLIFGHILLSKTR